MKQPYQPRLETAGADLRAKAERAIEKHGAHVVARAASVAISTLWKTVAGAKMQRGSLLAIRDGVMRLEGGEE